MTNLLVLDKSRRKPTVGDFFALRLRETPYYFGRVVKLVPKMIPGEINGPLIYIYNIPSKRLNVPEELSSDQLLCPPMATNFLPWSRGYFKFIENAPIEPQDLLSQHCFYSPGAKRYFDEEGRALARKVEPCGFFGLHSFRTIDDEISKALGLELVPDQDE